MPYAKLASDLRVPYRVYPRVQALPTSYLSRQVILVCTHLLGAPALYIPWWLGAVLLLETLF